MNKEEFQQKINSTEKPIVVDFWAAWCGPCKMTSPILEKLGAEYAERVEFLPIDADQAQELLERYRILGIPTVLVIRDGVELGRIRGAQTEAAYRTVFESLANNEKLNIPMSQADRTLRLGAGVLLIVYGFSNGNWLLVGIGGIITFLGFYDQCPIWSTLTRMFQRK